MRIRVAGFKSDDVPELELVAGSGTTLAATQTAGGEAQVTITGTGGGGTVTSVTAGDGSVTVAGTGAAPTVAVAAGGVTAAKLSSGAATAGSVAAADGAGNVVYGTPKLSTNGPLYNITPSAFQNWRKSLALVQAATAQGTANVYAKLLVVADSTATGRNAATGSPGLGSDVRTAWPTFLAALMKNAFPTVNESTYGNLNYTTGSLEPRITQTGGSGWQVVGTPFLSLNLSGGGINGLMAGIQPSQTGTLVFTPNAATVLDTVDIYFAVSPGTGTCAVLDGASSIGSIGGAGTATVQKTTLTLASRAASKVINIATPGATGYGFIVAIEAYDSLTPSVKMLNAASCAARIADWTGSLVSANAYPKAWLNNYQPNLVLLSVTVNDMTDRLTGTSPTAEATWQTSTISLINSIRTAGADVLLVAGPPTQTPISNYTSTTLAAYQAGLYAIADSANVGLVDTISRWTSYATSNPLGYYGDNAHPNPSGAADIAQAVFNALRIL